MISKNILLPIITIVFGIFVSSCGTTSSVKNYEDFAPNTLMGGEQSLPFGELKIWITEIAGEKKSTAIQSVNRKIPVSAQTQFIKVKVKLDAPDGNFTAKALLQANMTTPGHYYVTGEREGDTIKLWVQQSGTQQVVSKVNTQELM